MFGFWNRPGRRSALSPVSRRQRNLPVESLESRSMLAGNVAVELQGENLLVRGNRADNFIAITQTDKFNEYRITGLADDNGLATTINGAASAVFHAPGKVRIYMAGGNDRVEIRDFGVNGPILVDLGAGDDRVIVSNGRVDKLTLVGGDGNDVGRVEYSRIKGFYAFMGKGNDRLATFGLDAWRLFWIDGGKGSDTWAHVIPPSTTSELTGFEFEELHETVQGVVRTTLAEGQSRDLADTASESFTTDFDVVLKGGAPDSLAPIQRNVATGLTANVKVDDIAADGRSAQVSVDLDYTQVDHIFGHSFRSDDGRHQLDQPQISTTSLKTSARIADGAVVALGGETTEIGPADSGDALGTTLTATAQAHVRTVGENRVVELEIVALAKRVRAVPFHDRYERNDLLVLPARDIVNLLLVEGQEGVASRTTVQPLMTGVDVVTGAARTVNDPTVTDLATGVTVRATGDVSADRRLVTLDLDLLQHVLTEVPTYDVFSPHGPQSIQLPTRSNRELSTQVTVADGGTIQLGRVKLADRDVAVTVTPHVIAPAAAGEPLGIALAVRFLEATPENPGGPDGAVTIDNLVAGEFRHTLEKRYVTEFAVNSNRFARHLRPVVETFSLDDSLGVRPTISADRSRVSLEVEFHTESIVGRLREVFFRGPFGMQTTYHPTIASADAQRTVEAADGASVATGPITDSLGRRFRLVLTPDISAAGDAGVAPQVSVQVRAVPIVPPPV